MHILMLSRFMITKYIILYYVFILKRRETEGVINVRPIPVQTDIACIMDPPGCSVPAACIKRMSGLSKSCLSIIHSGAPLTISHSLLLNRSSSPVHIYEQKIWNMSLLFNLVTDHPGNLEGEKSKSTSSWILMNWPCVPAEVYINNRDFGRDKNVQHVRRKNISKNTYELP